ncbi:ABC transporter permease, partial [Melissococcus plutonius]|nr:ABC transporter permease [Melissococcus plutonius]
MIFKITWKKIESQFLNYSVYFISMIFAVMIYYCFSVIAYNQSLIKSAGKNIPIQGLMFSGNFLVVLMVLVFMLAANHFFLLKRNQEIKVYRLIGMRKS